MNISILSDVTTFATVICFVTGSEICVKIWKKRNTKDISPIPFMLGLINCSLWLRYGLETENTTIINTNFIGVSLFFTYNLFFYLMCNHRYSITKQYLVLFISLFFLWNIPSYLDDPKKFIGLIASTVNIIFFASPLSQIRVVLKNKSSESLPLLLILVSFFTSSLWLYLGFLIDDPFIKVPNLLAIAILGLQLVLYFIFYKSSNPEIEYSKQINGI